MRPGRARRAVMTRPPRPPPSHPRALPPHGAAMKATPLSKCERRFLLRAIQEKKVWRQRPPPWPFPHPLRRRPGSAAVPGIRPAPAVPSHGGHGALSVSIYSCSAWTGGSATTTGTSASPSAPTAAAASWSWAGPGGRGALVVGRGSNRV